MAVRRHARAQRIARHWKYRGSTAGRRGNKRRAFAAGLQGILRDYFGVGGLPPIYDEREFETRFRVPRAVFRRIYMAVRDEPFFQQRIDATGKLQAHPLQKVVAAFRVIAYGEAADRADEYVRLSRTTIATSIKLLMDFIVKRWGPTYLRRPSQDELNQIMERNKERGIPGVSAPSTVVTGSGTNVRRGWRGPIRVVRASGGSLWKLFVTRTCGCGTSL